MSYAVSTFGDKAEIVQKLRETTEQTYKDDGKSPGVREQIDKSIDFVDAFLSGLEDDGPFSVSLIGHVKQENEGSSRTSLSISVQPTTTIT